MTKINDLIAAGEKATQATWETDYTGNIWAGGTGADNGDPDLIYKPHGHPEENHLFIVAAANAREEIKLMWEQNQSNKFYIQELESKINEMSQGYIEISGAAKNALDEGKFLHEENKRLRGSLEKIVALGLRPMEMSDSIAATKMWSEAQQALGDKRDE